jgi:hypothetical protein
MSTNDPDINRLVNIFKSSETLSSLLKNAATEICSEAISFEICDVIIRIKSLNLNAKKTLIELTNIFFKIKLKR